MKAAKRMITTLLLCCLLLCGPIVVRAKTKDYGKAKYDRTRWADIRSDYLDTKTDRLIFVKCGGGTSATVEMWAKASKRPFSGLAAQKDVEQTGEEDTVQWEKIISCRAYTGVNGLDKKKEGDHKTPLGIFNITMGFGRKASPGTDGIAYTKLNPYHYWSSEKETYNQFVDVRTLKKSQMSGEHLIAYNPEYNYALALDYNKECTYRKGSAIFLHCMGKNHYTMGCIAVPEQIMKEIVRNTTKHTKICIYRK